MTTDSPTYDVRAGDALALLRELPTASVDAIITDPPYSSGGMVRGDRMASTNVKYVNSTTENRGVDFTGDNRDQRAYGYWSALWLGEALRVAKPGAVLCAFSDWRQLPATTDAVQAGGWVWRGIVPWHKPMHRPTLGRLTSACEYVVWGSAGGMDAEGRETVMGFLRPETHPLDLTDEQLEDLLPGYFSESPPVKGREHQTQKPVNVMRQLLRVVPRGGLILDPFSGSGTTGVAAALEGYSFLGFELHEHFAALARERIGAAFEQRPRAAAVVDQGDLFAASDLGELEPVPD